MHTSNYNTTTNNHVRYITNGNQQAIRTRPLQKGMWIFRKYQPCSHSIPKTFQRTRKFSLLARRNCRLWRIIPRLPSIPFGVGVQRSAFGNSTLHLVGLEDEATTTIIVVTVDPAFQRSRRSWRFRVRVLLRSLFFSLSAFC